MGLPFIPAVAHATQPDPEHKVGLCHRTASDTNPYVYIEVDEASLPAHLNDLPGHPAKVWKTDGTFRGVVHVAGDLKSDYLAETSADCVDNTSPTPTPTPTPTDSPTPTPTETTPPPTCHDDGSCFTPTWHPTWQPTGGPGPGNHPLAHTGFSAGKAAAAAGALTLAGLASLAWVRRKAIA
jgi:hypothetical protein